MTKTFKCTCIFSTQVMYICTCRMFSWCSWDSNTLLHVYLAFYNLYTCTTIFLIENLSHAQTGVPIVPCPYSCPYWCPLSHAHTGAHCPVPILVPIVPCPYWCPLSHAHTGVHCPMPILVSIVPCPYWCPLSLAHTDVHCPMPILVPIVPCPYWCPLSHAHTGAHCPMHICFHLLYHLTPCFHVPMPSCTLPPS